MGVRDLPKMIKPIYSFVQQIFTKCMLCLRHCSQFGCAMLNQICPLLSIDRFSNDPKIRMSSVLHSHCLTPGILGYKWQACNLPIPEAQVFQFMQLVRKYFATMFHELHDRLRVQRTVWVPVSGQSIKMQTKSLML